MATNMSSETAAAKKRLKNALKELQAAILALEETPDVAEGPADGLLAQHFSDHSIDEEGPWFTLNRAWERVFQRSEHEQQCLVSCGPYGLQLVYDFLKAVIKIDGISEVTGLMLDRVTWLHTLIITVYVQVF